MEERLFFQSGDLKLEGILDFRSAIKGVVITHPHPLYGGDMENMVVELISEVYQQKGFTTLRFNFRGVGASDGAYSEGAGEANDVCAASEFLSKKGIKEIHLAGYSFGAWVNASVDCSRISYAKKIMVSPPAAFLDFSPAKPIEHLKLVVTGSKDELAPPSEIAKYLPVWNSSAVFEVIEGADHFFWEHLRFLDEILFAHI